MKDKSVKMRTITITGPFGIDDDGDEYGAPGEGGFVYSLHELKRNPAFTCEVEDVPRTLPTEKGAVIRATVIDRELGRVPDQLLILDDTDARPWRAISPETLDADWYGPEDIGDDWVELVPRSE